MIEKLQDYLRQNGKLTGGVVLAVVAALALGFALGRYNRVTQVQETFQTKEVQQQVVKTVYQTVEKVVYVQVKQQDVHREVVEEKKPDGTVVTKTVEDIHEHEQTQEVATRETQASTQSTEKDVKETDSKKTVDGRAQWHLSVQAGVGITDIKALKLGNLPVGLTFGGQLERRVVGPLWMGIWGSTAKAGGLSLGLEF